MLWLSWMLYLFDDDDYDSKLFNYPRLCVYGIQMDRRLESAVAKLAIRARLNPGPVQTDIIPCPSLPSK